VTEVVGGQDHAGPMVMVGGDLYFINDRGVANSSENLAVLPRGGVVRDLGAAFGFVDQLEYDSARQALYWVTGLHWAVAEVVVYHLDGAFYPQLIFPAQDVMGSSASDTDYLYWLSEHAVTRLKKWP
jgi:hypothetical protein